MHTTSWELATGITSIALLSIGQGRIAQSKVCAAEPLDNHLGRIAT